MPKMAVGIPGTALGSHHSVVQRRAAAHLTLINAEPPAGSPLGTRIYLFKPGAIFDRRSAHGTDTDQSDRRRRRAWGGRQGFSSVRPRHDRKSDTGAVGGGVLAQIVTLILPVVSASVASGHFSVESIATSLISGGAGGAILTAIFGDLKNKVA